MYTVCIEKKVHLFYLPIKICHRTRNQIILKFIDRLRGRVTDQGQERGITSGPLNRVGKRRVQKSRWRAGPRTYGRMWKSYRVGSFFPSRDVFPSARTTRLESTPYVMATAVFIIYRMSTVNNALVLHAARSSGNE